MINAERVFVGLLLLASALLTTGCSKREQAAAAPSASAALPAPPVGLLTVGSKAPDFAARDATGKVVHLDDFRDKPRVVYFYPKDGTPGCTVEAQSFRDSDAQFRAKGVVVFGVSRDTDESHSAFRAAQGLPFALAADPDGVVQKSYGVPDLGLPLASRMSFLIGRDGRVERVFDKVDPANHVNEVLALVQ
ncbi:MAG TPA: peroxiredoxin [Polyangiaceae bacterium]|jgi:peroxiredoxin Q/BCP|nr:peroxiredoxin [Polyangiaceae bacterium]